MIEVRRAGVAAPEVPADLGAFVLPDDAVWIDLLEPTPEEEAAVERALGLELPTREEMKAIELSSRLYFEGEAAFMTATVLYNSDAEIPASGPITFVLTPGRLVTIRYFSPTSFKLYAARLQREPRRCLDGVHAFLDLISAVVDRTSDNLERTAVEVDQLSREIFARRPRADYGRAIAALGRNQTAAAKIRDSLASLSRLIAFAGLVEAVQAAPDGREHLKTLQRDVQSVADHAAYVVSNVTFLLDAALGLINIEQTAIIKIFSVAAVVFLPPTLIASIYGMNFDHMPELAQAWGYPAALAAMLVSAVAPLLWFKRKGWL